MEDKKEDIMDFFQFQERLATQMLAYSPKSEYLPGDQFMRTVTSTPKANRVGRAKSSRGEDIVNCAQFSRAKRD